MDAISDKQAEALKGTLVAHLNWGAVSGWSTRDFDHLSELIFDKTSIRLSVTTLKRFLGKVAYENKPAPATLDAISAFVGYANYLDFYASIPKAEKRLQRPFPKRKGALALMFGVLVAGVILTLAFMDRGVSGLDASRVSFSIKKVTTGLPNTVVFNYDVTRVSAEQVEIQQDWDSTKRYAVDPAQHVFTHYYEYPGYYNAKLVVNSNILLEEDLFIPSDGWLAVLSDVNGQRPPRYLGAGEFESDSLLRVSDAVLGELRQAPDASVLDFYNAFADPSTDFSDFEFRARIRFNIQSGKIPCEFRKIVFFGTKMFMRIPLSVPGCVAQNRLKLGSKVVDGAENDLSEFSVESGQWAAVKVTNKSNSLSVYVDEKLVFETRLTDDFGKLAGVRFSFNGSGEVSHLQLTSEGKELLMMEAF